MRWGHSQHHRTVGRQGRLFAACSFAVRGQCIAAWLQLKPSRELALTDAQFATALAYQLGVDHQSGDPGACRLCGSARGARGGHDLSCGSGGDPVHRHNAVRDLVYELARRAHVQPLLERAGILAGAALHVELRRPADVLVHLARDPPRRIRSP